MHQRDVLFCGTIRGNEPYLFERLEPLEEIYPMNILPVDRALSIYGALANRSETKGARERLSKHPMKMYIEGEKDEHRLTDREIDSRN